jgi:hypothetical protein
MILYRDADYSDVRSTLLTNRDKNTAPKLGRIWCVNCDSVRVGEGEKCPACGFKRSSNRHKK